VDIALEFLVESLIPVSHWMKISVPKSIIIQREMRVLHACHSGSVLKNYLKLEWRLMMFLGSRSGHPRLRG
jgi:hypothetical protein